MIYKYLSHPFTPVIPAYGGMKSITLKKIKSLQQGDSSNAFLFALQNHWGTHVDAPNHFYEQGKKIIDFEANFWIFRNPQVMGFNLEPSEILICGDWMNKLAGETDLLLLKTSWSSFRDQDVYHSQNPGIHPDVGFFLRKNYPKLRAVGIDWISISAYQHREMGRNAHRAFLDPQGENEPILIIEDLDLRGYMTDLAEVWALPLRIEGLDSAPCTVVGVFRN